MLAPLPACVAKASSTKARFMTTPNRLEDDPHPVCQSGSKNVFCPYYERCLDYAAEKNWGYWNCSVCPHRLTQVRLKSYPSIDDSEPLCHMPWEIYRQVMTRLGCVKRAGHDSHGSE